MREFSRFCKGLQEYKDKFGNCRVEHDFIASNGIDIKKFARNIRDKKIVVSEVEKETLDGMGFVWKIYKRRKSFLELLSLLLKYRDERGLQLLSYEDLLRIDSELAREVSKIKSGEIKVTQTQRELLEKVGVLPQAVSQNISFEKIYELLVEYYFKKGNLFVPLEHTVDGIPLGVIVREIRTGAIKLSEKNKRRLEEINFAWSRRYQKIPFKDFYSQLKKFKNRYGHCNVELSYVTNEGIPLGVTVFGIRNGNLKITPRQKQLLDEIDFWQKSTSRRNTEIK